MTIRHVVLFKFQPQAEVARVEAAFAALPGAIAEIASFEWGTNNSPEGLDHGFTHCFTLGFKDAAARDAYLVHPDHQAFSTLARPNVAEVLVIDYETRTESSR